MLSNFIQKNIAKAKYKLLEDKTYFGEIPGLRGVWAVTKILKIVGQSLQES